MILWPCHYQPRFPPLRVIHNALLDTQVERNLTSERSFTRIIRKLNTRVRRYDASVLSRRLDNHNLYPGSSTSPMSFVSIIPTIPVVTSPMLTHTFLDVVFVIRLALNPSRHPHRTRTRTQKRSHNRCRRCHSRSSPSLSPSSNSHHTPPRFGY